MLHEHLRNRALAAQPMVAATHLDEDSLSAFVEGRLSENESSPVVKHLVACSFCRNITAQLVRLDSEVGENNVVSPAAAEEPGRMRRLLDDLASRVFPASEGDSVFAYHAPADDFKKKDEAEAAESREPTDDLEEKPKS
jgi:anti-sigma factor RsiW